MTSTPDAATGPTTSAPKMAVELRGITVRFGAVVANRDVSLSVAKGQVHAIVGENGAGKSTLMRALYGLSPIASGEVWIGGERVERPSPAEAIRRGVGMVHQHFMLVDTLSVAENVVLGVEPSRGMLGTVGWIDRRRSEAEVAALASRHGLAVGAKAERGGTVADLSVGEQQRVEILKTLYRGARILILDEPTAVLTPPEVADLFRVLRAITDGGGTVLIVTHKLDEVQAIADAVTVLRRGEVVARHLRGEATAEEIAREMVGRDLAGPTRVSFANADEKGSATRSEVRLALRDLAVSGRGGNALDGVSLEVRAGEILGIAGVEGNGQAELLAAVSGRIAPARGHVLLDGKDVNSLSAGGRRKRGLGYVPEDRHRLALLLDLSVADNLLLGREAAFSRFGHIDRARLDADCRRLLAAYDVRPADPAAPVRSLSGGNQQKLVIARELSRSPRVLLAAQPTRGVDIGAIEHIHRALDGARAAGCAILLVSAELDELLALSDRICVLYRGRIVATLDRADADAARLGALMTGAAA